MLQDCGESPNRKGPYVIFGIFSALAKDVWLYLHVVTIHQGKVQVCFGHGQNSEIDLDLFVPGSMGQSTADKETFLEVTKTPLAMVGDGIPKMAIENAKTHPQPSTILSNNIWNDIDHCSMASFG